MPVDAGRGGSIEKVEHGNALGPVVSDGFEGCLSLQFVERIDAVFSADEPACFVEKLGKDGE